jgi:hypothetical protein
MDVPPGAPGDGPTTPRGSSGGGPGTSGAETRQRGNRGDSDADPTSETNREDTVISVATIGIDQLNQTPVRERGLVVELVKEEVVRAAVALLLIVLFAGVVLAAFLKAKTWTDMKELLNLVLPAVTALLGSALGFYFGKKSD